MSGWTDRTKCIVNVTGNNGIGCCHCRARRTQCRLPAISIKRRIRVQRKIRLRRIGLGHMIPHAGNHAGLMHTGEFSERRNRRFTILEVGGQAAGNELIRNGLQACR